VPRSSQNPAKKKKYTHGEIHGAPLLCIAAGLSPCKTCKVTLAGSALDGLQEYLPESESRTCRKSSEVLVTGLLLSVTMATPPRAES